MSTSTTSRPQDGRVNPYETGDYPIILGESLKSDSSQPNFLRFKYNWEPRDGFTNQKGTLKRSNGQTQLKYQDSTSASSTYEYTALTSNHDDDESGSRISHFALVFDSQKSAYVLEQISQSFDLNLTSAHDQSREEIGRHTQISTSSEEKKPSEANGTQSTTDNDDDEADAANPFDFRHFMSEAKENAEKAAQPTGSRTPLPGSRTPISGISSPSLGANRFLSANTPQFRPTPRSAPAPSKSASAKAATTSTTKSKTTAKRKQATTKTNIPQPISKEIVSDSSDEETQPTVTVSRPSIAQIRERNRNRAAAAAATTTSTPRSPPKAVDDSVLEFELGSPPPETRRNMPMIDRDAFRSGTNTPTPGLNTYRPPPPLTGRDIEMRDRSDDSDEDEDADRDERRHDNGDGDDDAYMDEDVDVLDIGSPRSQKEEARKEIAEEAPSAPTPLPAGQEDDEDADDLERELEAVLYGEESEVSEEE